MADAVYETLFDGMELEELFAPENIEVLHYLMIDDYFTWWVIAHLTSMLATH